MSPVGRAYWGLWGIVPKNEAIFSAHQVLAEIPKIFGLDFLATHGAQDLLGGQVHLVISALLYSF